MISKKIYVSQEFIDDHVDFAKYVENFIKQELEKTLKDYADAEFEKMLYGDGSPEPKGIIRGIISKVSA